MWRCSQTRCRSYFFSPTIVLSFLDSIFLIYGSGTSDWVIIQCGWLGDDMSVSRTADSTVRSSVSKVRRLQGRIDTRGWGLHPENMRRVRICSRHTLTPKNFTFFHFKNCYWITLQVSHHQGWQTQKHWRNNITLQRVFEQIIEHIHQNETEYKFCSQLVDGYVHRQSANYMDTW